MTSNVLANHCVQGYCVDLNSKCIKIPINQGTNIIDHTCVDINRLDIFFDDCENNMLVCLDNITKKCRKIDNSYLNNIDELL